jgi:GNAT superfamily N-acetyltransferase
VEGARPATQDDLARIAELASGAIEELRSTKGGDVWARAEARAVPVEASIAAAIDDGDQRVVAGTIDEVIVGYGIAHIEVLRDGGLLGVVDDLYVEPLARDVSIGEVIMDDLLAWCEERGCFGVDSLALPGNRATKNFFERFGLVARAIVVHKPLR